MNWAEFFNKLIEKEEFLFVILDCITECSESLFYFIGESDNNTAGNSLRLWNYISA